MVSREKALQIVLLFIISLLRFCSTLQIGSCIRYETYLVTDYKMMPFDFSDDWFSHPHLTPRKLTRVGLRSRRLYGCCDAGYRYQSYPDFGCKPICSRPCPLNSRCSQPGQCSCDNGHHIVYGVGCVPNSQTMIEATTTAEPITTTEPLPCNGSCRANEKCQQPENICICIDDYQRPSGNAECVPTKLTTEPYTEPTTTETESEQPTCNGLCGPNEECSTSDSICICKDGYQRSTNTTCESKCEPKCQNSNCAAPNTCDCWTNYERINSTFCHSKCSEQSCMYGNCNPDGICECAAGFLNNGTACIWAGDAILTEPDDCDCWSQFVWQKNVTEISVRECMALCDADDSVEVTSDCIDSKHCQCYEGFLVCRAKIYKCFAAEPSLTAYSSDRAIPLAEQVADSKSSVNVTLIIFALSAIVLVVGASLLIWQKRRSWLNRPSAYNHMNSAEEQLL